MPLVEHTTSTLLLLALLSKAGGAGAVSVAYLQYSISNATSFPLSHANAHLLFDF